MPEVCTDLKSCSTCGFQIRFRSGHSDILGGVCASGVFLRCIVQGSAGTRRTGEADDFLVKWGL